MTSRMIIFSIVLIIIGVLFFYSYIRSNSIITDNINSPVIYTDSNSVPKYAIGNCSGNGDCFQGGCSSQMCSTDPELITTCELSEDFPDKNVYSCGCVSGKCVWYKAP